MADILYKMRCVNPNYLKERYGMIQASYGNRFKSVRPYRYHYVFIKDDCHLYDTMDYRHDYQTINLETCGFKTNINVAIFSSFELCICGLVVPRFELLTVLCPRSSHSS